jgi:8-oxo-dGTP pyrophosphatase MutT (NUDIX family)
MISFRLGSHRFHYRAGAVLVDDDYLLLHQLEGDNFWALPGGRVNSGETGQSAIRREFMEELGTTVECGPLLCTGENFFEYEGEPFHEVGLYFSAKLPSSSAFLVKNQVHLGTEAGRTLHFKWFPLIELQLIDMRPTALRYALAGGTLPNHFVQQR